jgi:hypothetical protein
MPNVMSRHHVRHSSFIIHLSALGTFSPLATQEGRNIKLHLQTFAIMKKIFGSFALLALCFTAVTAQTNVIAGNSPQGADPMALKVEFPPADALLIDGQIHMGVSVKATAKNIGTVVYLPTAPEKLKLVLYQKVNGQWVAVKEMGLFMLQPGLTASLQYYTSYIQGVEPKPEFTFKVESKNGGVVNPDVNMANNKIKISAP